MSFQSKLASTKLKHQFVMQADDEEADWDLEMMNEEDDGVVHWVSALCALQALCAIEPCPCTF